MYTVPVLEAEGEELGSSFRMTFLENTLMPVKKQYLPKMGLMITKFGLDSTPITNLNACKNTK